MCFRTQIIEFFVLFRNLRLFTCRSLCALRPKFLAAGAFLRVKSGPVLLVLHQSFALACETLWKEIPIYKWAGMELEYLLILRAASVQISE